MFISINVKGMEERHRKYAVLHKAINPFRTISPTDQCPFSYWTNIKLRTDGNFVKIGKGDKVQ